MSRSPRARPNTAPHNVQDFSATSTDAIAPTDAARTRGPRSEFSRPGSAPGGAATTPAARTANASDAKRRSHILARLGERCRELLQPVLMETLRQHVAALREHADAQTGSIDGVAVQRAAARLEEESAAVAADVLNRIQTHAERVGSVPEHARAPEELRLIEEDDLLDHLAVHRTAAAACRPHQGVPQQFLRRLAALNGASSWRGERAPFGPAALAAALNDTLIAHGQARTYRELALVAFARALGQCALRFYGALDEVLAAHRIEPLRDDTATARSPTAKVSDPPLASGPLASLDTIGDALAARRHALGTPPSSGGGPVLAGTALDKALETLQRMPATPRVPEHAAATLKQRIAACVSGGTQPSSARFERRTDDTIEFVDLVFEHLLRHGAGTAPAQALLRHLEIPTLRVALNDAGFFSNPQHPVRRLLNVVSEIALYWLDPQRTDSELHKLTRAALEQIADQPTLPDDQFADIADRLTRAVDRLSQRASVLETRLVARAVAQEKLEVARRRAAAVCAEICADLAADTPRRVFLETTWKDVLVLTLLRSGGGSERWRERTEAARWLARARGQRETLTETQFRRIAEQAITLLGFQPAEIEAQLGKLLRLEASTLMPSATDASRTHLPAPALSPIPASSVARLADGSASDVEASSEAASTPTQAATSIDASTPDEAATFVDASTRSEAAPSAADASTPFDVAPSATALARREAPLPTATALPGEAAPMANPPMALSVEERRVSEQLRTVPFGSWFEFRRSDKTCERQKLAWFSTVTERCLFVAPDGKRAQYRSLDELARAVVRNEARVLDISPRSWFDGAWRTVTDGLRAFLTPDARDPSRA